MSNDPSATVEPATTVLDASSILGRNRPILLAALKQGGVSTATVTYAGSGDSGSVEEVAVESATGTRFDTLALITVFANQSDYRDRAWHAFVVEQQVSVDQALRDFAEEAVELLHGGWENNDGASGSVVFDCENGTVRVEHTAYFTDSDYEETEL